MIFNNKKNEDNNDENNNECKMNIFDNNFITMISNVAYVNEKRKINQLYITLNSNKLINHINNDR